MHPKVTEMMEQQHPGIHAHSPPASKIALFRSLFRGREDVYPRRFDNRKTGCSGYSPACSSLSEADTCVPSGERSLRAHCRYYAMFVLFKKRIPGSG